MKRKVGLPTKNTTSVKLSPNLIRGWKQKIGKLLSKLYTKNSLEEVIVEECLLSFHFTELVFQQRHKASHLALETTVHCNEKTRMEVSPGSGTNVSGNLGQIFPQLGFSIFPST